MKCIDREDWEGLVGDYDDDCIRENGYRIGYKFSDTYKPEMKEIGEIHIILLNDPRCIFA